MPILIMGLTALMVFAVMGLILFGATRAEHRQREKDRNHPFPMA